MFRSITVSTLTIPLAWLPMADAPLLSPTVEGTLVGPRPPVFLTPLIGREGDLEQVLGQLRGARLLSLVGPGGTGKTRLAAAVADSMARRKDDSTAWIDLVPVDEPGLVARHVAATMGLREHPSRGAEQALAERIGGASLLLVLDNCEHLLEECGALADFLLRACPGLRILTTTREPLAVAGEKAWRVPPLEVPSESAAGVVTAAVQLFVQRAGDAVAGFRLTPENAPAIARICRRLDGLPLAIELAAARVASLAPEQLADRLDDSLRLLASRSPSLPARHRTLRGMIDWSYALLPESERELFDLLAIFVGGFTLDAAERILGPHAGGDVLDLLGALVEKSLVAMREWEGEARYGLLETVRQYAAERLAARSPGELEGIRLAHGEFYAEWVERYGEAARQGDARARARMDAEHDNARSAIQWALEGGRAALALRLCIGLADHWRIRGYLSLGLALTLAAIERAGADPRTERTRARALVSVAVHGRMMGRFAELQGWLRSAVESARTTGDAEGLADALTQLGLSLRDHGHIDDARERLDEALGIYRELGAARGLSAALGARASVALVDRQTGLARALREEASRVARGSGDREGEAHALIGLGEVARMDDDPEEARRCNLRCLQLFGTLGDTWHAAAANQNLGWIEAQMGDGASSFRAFASCVAGFRFSGNPFGLTLCLFGYAHLLLRLGEVEAAAVSLAAASANAERVGVRPAAPADVVACAMTAEGIERSLSPAALAEAGRVGAALGLAEALDAAEARLRVHYPAEASTSPSTADPEVVAESPGPPHPPALADPLIGPQSSDEGDGREHPRRRRTDVPSPAAAPSATPVPAPAPAPPTVQRISETPDLEILALGPLRISVQGEALEGDAFLSSKPRELLLLLVCHPNGLTREQVGVEFWPDFSTAQVKNSFHVMLHRLRKAIGRPDWIVVEGERYRLDPAVEVFFDAAWFEAEAREAIRGLDSGAPEGSARTESVLARYRGDFLEGLGIGDWHLPIRDRLRQLFCDTLLAYASHLLADGRTADAVDAYQTLLSRDRLHEKAYQGLMLCHARSGNRAQAARLFDTLTTLLDAEVGASPDPSTVDLLERIQRSDPL